MEYVAIFSSYIGVFVCFHVSLYMFILFVCHYTNGLSIFDIFSIFNVVCADLNLVCSFKIST